MWAFATSIDGLGLSPERFWHLAMVDYLALKKVYDDRRAREFQLWAVERVEFRNAHQMFGDEGIPWETNDLTGGDRHARALKAKNEKVENEMRLLKMQRGLGSITKDHAPDELLPSWAKRQWDPADYPELFGGAKKQ